MNTVTLINGTQVATDSDAWREECLVRHRHVQNLRRLDRLGCHDYLTRVRRAEGDVAGDRLQQAYADDWERRKAERNALMRAQPAKTV
jgi:hypothetical protein